MTWRDKVEVVNSGYSKNPGMMQLIHCLFFIWAFFNISLRVVRIPEHLNIAVASCPGSQGRGEREPGIHRLCMYLIISNFCRFLRHQ